MFTVLLILHLFVTLALIGVVLIQRSEGGGLGIGSSQSMGSFMGGRGTANLLTRTTAVLATIFMGLSLALALMNRSGTASDGLLGAPPPPPAKVAPVAPPPPPGPVVPGSTAPAAPASPAPAKTAPAGMAPASTAPAGTAPASTAPASTAPVPAAPAASAPAPTPAPAPAKPATGG